MRIKAKQVMAFGERAIAGEYASVLNYAREAFPHHFQVHGAASCKQLVDETIALAARYGLTSAYAQQVCTALAFWFGARFDVDPLLPWAQHWLRDDFLSQDEIAHELYEDSLAHIAEVTGNDEQDLALLSVAATNIDTSWAHGSEPVAPKPHAAAKRVAEPPTAAAPARWSSWLGTVHPRKCQAVGQTALSNFIEWGLAQANTRRLLSPASRRRYLLLMFFLGGGFEQDPRFNSLRQAVEAIVASPDAAQESVAMNELDGAVQQALFRWAKQMAAADSLNINS